MSAFITPTPQGLDYYCFTVDLEIRYGKSSNFVFFFNIVLVILGALKFHINISISLPISAKSRAAILVEIA